MPRKSALICQAEQLREQVIALAKRRIAETSPNAGHTKDDFARWVPTELQLFNFEEIWAKATGCESCSCLTFIHEEIFAAPTLHVLSHCSANEHWFWRIVLETANNAKSLPVPLEVIEAAAKKIAQEVGAQLVERTGDVFVTAGEFDVASLRSAYTDRTLFKRGAQWRNARSVALELGILIKVPPKKEKLNPLMG